MSRHCMYVESFQTFNSEEDNVCHHFVQNKKKKNVKTLTLNQIFYNYLKIN